MKGIGSAKLILLHPSPLNKSSAAGPAPLSPVSLLVSHHRLWLLVFLSFFTIASLVTFLCTARDPRLPPSSSASFSAAGAEPTLPPAIFDALVHYAAASNSTARMSEADLRAIARVLRRRAPCSLLVFGLGAETPLWRALNHGGRTVFLDENQYYVAHLEGRHPGLEAYDVAYATRVRDLPELLAAARLARAGDCRPVQNLLFSECGLALSDLPNHLYDVAWDVILVDGPRGFSASAPGRMASIFTAAVMARSAGEGPTDVLVHDYEREAERRCSEEFLCVENLVAETSGTTTLAHFIIRSGAAARRDQFCPTDADARKDTVQ